MIGLLLAGSVYWACTVLVLHFHAFGEEMAAAASLPNIVVRLFGVQALWIACVIGYLACFASLNIYIQSFARLVWSQAQHKPASYLARLSPRQIPRNALNAVLGCCVISALCIYALNINLDALIDHHRHHGRDAVRSAGYRYAQRPFWPSPVHSDW